MSAGPEWDRQPPCPRLARRRGVDVVCTLRLGHLAPCCWWAAAQPDRGAGAARKDADSMGAAETGRFGVNGRPNTRSTSAMLAESESGPGAAQTAPDPANPDETGASDDER